MATDYDSIADRYRRSKVSPWRTYIEKYTFLDVLGDLAGRSVLDLACGEGFYTRLFKASGAARVLGVDLSAGMLKLARATEVERPLGIQYVLGDAREFRTGQSFDVVAAAYLLNYADTEQALESMCRTISAALEPGGRFVTVNNNPLHSPDRFEATRKYGFIKSVTEALRPGTPITYTIFQDGGSFSFDNYYLSPEAHERALEKAGFRDIEWLQPRLSPAWSGDATYWDTLFEDPPVVFLRCSKG